MSEEDKKIDYLEVDEQVPGQNYVCMSFLSPESFVQNREAFNTAKFLQSYCKDQKLKFEEVYEKYKDFTYKHEDDLQRDYDEKNEFQTSLRGIKIRGVYDTRQAAEDRAKKLSTRDSSFHVFIGQIGYWLPWEPNADKVADEVFQNSQLNDMMEKYQENNVSRDIFYDEQKRDKIKTAREEVRKNKENKAEEERVAAEKAAAKAASIEDMEPEPETETSDAVEPVAEKPVEGEPETAEPETAEPETAEPETAETETAETEPQAEEDPKPEGDIPTSENKLDKDLTDSLEDSDPWMQQKLERQTQ